MYIGKINNSFVLILILTTITTSFFLSRQKTLAKQSVQPTINLDQTIVEKLEKGQLLAPQEIERVHQARLNHLHGKTKSKQEALIAKMAANWLPKNTSKTATTDRLILQKLSKGHMLSPNELQRLKDIEAKAQTAAESKDAAS